MTEVDYAKAHQDWLASEVRGVIDDSMANSARSVFGRSKLGVSDIGHCREYARRLILGEERDNDQQSYLAAFVGTAVGDRFEDEWVRRYPTFKKQEEVVVTLTVGDLQLKIPGHPDLVGIDEVIDCKTQDGLGVARNKGATNQQKYQLSLYAKALVDAGRISETAWLSLVFIDRSGSEHDPVVVSWQYDPDLVREAEQWLDDVIYAVVNGEEASRDMPRDWCFACCDFAPSCRGLDTDVQGLIEDPLIRAAVDEYKEALAREAAAKKDKESALSLLENVNGSTGTWNIRHVNVVPVLVPEHTRAGYSRISVTKVPPPKRKKEEA